MVVVVDTDFANWMGCWVRVRVTGSVRVSPFYIGWLAEKLVAFMVDWLVGWLSDWFDGWLVGRSVGWFVRR